jgi:hypothetical protein
MKAPNNLLTLNIHPSSYIRNPIFFINISRYILGLKGLLNMLTHFLSFFQPLTKVMYNDQLVRIKNGTVKCEYPSYTSNI